MLVDALALEFVEPLIQRLLAEAAVPAELYPRDAAGARLHPHPVLGHAQAFGDVVTVRRRVTSPKAASASLSEDAKALAERGFRGTCP